MKRSLATLLILSTVSVGVPAPAWAGLVADETSRAEVTAKTTLLAPAVLRRSIAVAAHRAALQAPQTGTPGDKHSEMACRTGALLLGGAGAAFVTAWVKHRNWASSGATTTPGAKPPSSVGWSVAVGALLAGAGIFTMSKTCAQ